MTAESFRHCVSTGDPPEKRFLLCIGDPSNGAWVQWHELQDAEGTYVFKDVAEKATATRLSLGKAQELADWLRQDGWDADGNPIDGEKDVSIHELVHW